MLDGQFEVDKRYSTDFDDRVYKLNKRLSLIGSKNRYCTDGAIIYSSSVDHNGQDNILMKNPLIMTKPLNLKINKQSVIDIYSVLVGGVNIESDNTHVLDYISLDIRDRTLRYKSLMAKEAYGIVFDTYIPKRMSRCLYDDAYIDLSNCEFVDRLTTGFVYVGVEESNDIKYMRYSYIDFKDKYVMLSSKPFVTETKDKLYIRATNKEMIEQIEHLDWGETRYEIVTDDKRWYTYCRTVK